jgi:hypothetical protein
LTITVAVGGTEVGDAAHAAQIVATINSPQNKSRRSEIITLTFQYSQAFSRICHFERSEKSRCRYDEISRRKDRVSK